MFRGRMYVPLIAGFVVFLVLLLVIGWFVDAPRRRDADH